MNSNNTKFPNAVLVLGGVVFMILTVGFYTRLPWAMALWPWPDGRLSYIFIASITAAIGVPILWIGLSGEFGAAVGGAINLAVTSAGTAYYFFTLNSRNPELQILISAIISTIAVPVVAAVYVWSKKQAIRDRRAMPGLVKISFILFTMVLVVAAIMLVGQRAVIFPWPLNPDSSAIFGFIFFWAAFYFASALSVPRWHNARGQLLGFLAYDLDLLLHFKIRELRLDENSVEAVLTGMTFGGESIFGTDTVRIVP